MENNIPTLYILQRDSYVVKSAKMVNYFRPFCPKNIKHSSYYLLPWQHDTGKVSLRSVFI